MGLTYTLAVVVGTVIGTAFDMRAAYLVTAGVLVALSAQFLIGFAATGKAQAGNPPTPEPDVVPIQPAQPSLEATRTLRIDYWWVFLARLVVTLGQSIALFYLLYYLRDRIEYDDPDAGVLTLTVVYEIAVVITAVFAGGWSGRAAKRKPLVAIAS